MIVAGVNLKLAQETVVSWHFDRSDLLSASESVANIPGHAFFSLLQIKRRSSGEKIYALFLGINFVWIARRIWRQRFEFVIPWPERKLVHHVLGLRNVDRRMSRPCGPFIWQIKRQFGRAITFVC